MATPLRIAALFLLTMVAVADARESVTRASPDLAHANEEMRVAAVAWLDSLDADLRARANFPFGSTVRTDWHFIPKERDGVAFKAMSLDQRRAARALMRSALSDRGYLKATTIMSLEQVLREIESDRPEAVTRRDQEKYWFAVFGDPAANEEPWGWRVEGHHLSLNFTSVAGEETTVAASPLFLGANPAEIRTGPRAGLRPLGHEDDLGRSLMASLDDSQRAQAMIATRAPDDVAAGPGAPPVVEGPTGLVATEMTDSQRGLLRELFEAFAHTLRAELAEEEIAQFELDQVYFSWAGSVADLDKVASNERHYFRLHGPRFIIEYDFQEPNHVHAVWRSPDGDFGDDALQRHYETHAH